MQVVLNEITCDLLYTRSRHLLNDSNRSARGFRDDVTSSTVHRTPVCHYKTTPVKKSPPANIAGRLSLMRTADATAVAALELTRANSDASICMRHIIGDR